jgi:hypothetical protein
VQNFLREPVSWFEWRKGGENALTVDQAITQIKAQFQKVNGRALAIAGQLKRPEMRSGPILARRL